MLPCFPYPNLLFESSLFPLLPLERAREESPTVNNEKKKKKSTRWGPDPLLCYPVTPAKLLKQPLTSGVEEKKPAQRQQLIAKTATTNTYIDEETAGWRQEERSGGEEIMIEEENGADARLQAISAAIRVVPHFPKPGIMFNDITPLLLRPKVFKDAVEFFVDRYRSMGISAVAGIEARGFIFGSSLALAIGAKFIPLQKPKKLPGEVFSEAYELEYGKDCLEMHVGAVQPRERVLIFDDLIATGGTLCAAMKLIEKAGGEVVECACLIGSPKFKGRYRLNGKPVYVLVECRR